MKISTRARYGTRAMMDIAMHSHEGPVMVKDIAQRQQISPRYLEQLLFNLKLAGFITSVRGVRGGFLLARPAKNIKLLDIVQALDGSIAPVSCVDQPDLFARSKYCAAHDLWCEIKMATHKILNSVTLADLVLKQKKKEELAQKNGAIGLQKMNAKCTEEILPSI